MDIVHSKRGQVDYEFIEVKGVGHPDSLADSLANCLSRRYSLTTLQEYGAILHHNIDKLMLLGGASFVRFSEGYLTKPIRVIMNGRFSDKFADEEIDIQEILYPTVEKFFKAKFGSLIPSNMIEIINQLSTSSSPGIVVEEDKEMGVRLRWFNPRSLMIYLNYIITEQMILR